MRKAILVIGLPTMLSIVGLYLLYSDDPMVQQSVCMVRHTGREAAQCFLDETCRSLIQCMRTCDDPSSSRRIRAREQNPHLQHPDSPLPCTVGCMDDFDNEVVDDFLTAFMGKECAADSQLVDVCFDVGAVPPFSDNPSEFDMSFLEGEWESIRTGGWDHWDCQKKIFFPPGNVPEGAPYHSVFWATYRTYPKSRGGAPKDNYALEEVYPNTNAPNGPTFSTNFVLWGTQSHENWHIFAFSRGNEETGEPAWVVAQVCIDTPSINHTDVFGMVLAKTANPSQELSDHIDQIVEDKIGYPLARVNNQACDPDPVYERKR